jgi:hypothetical protein
VKKVARYWWYKFVNAIGSQISKYFYDIGVKPIDLIALFDVTLVHEVRTSFFLCGILFNVLTLWFDSLLMPFNPTMQVSQTPADLLEQPILVKGWPPMVGITSTTCGLVVAPKMQARPSYLHKYLHPANQQVRLMGIFRTRNPADATGK